MIAIPTYNRCKYLKNNIHFFDQQRRPDNVRVSLAISNSASVDETEQYLSELQSSRKTFLIQQADRVQQIELWLFMYSYPR